VRNILLRHYALDDTAITWGTHISQPLDLR
jgi:hypothetical protein